MSASGSLSPGHGYSQALREKENQISESIPPEIELCLAHSLGIAEGNVDLPAFYILSGPNL